MFQYSQDHGSHAVRSRKPQRLPGPLLSSMIITVSLAILGHLYLLNRGRAEIEKLQSDVSLVRKQMANKDDVTEIRLSLLQLEKDIRRMSDNLKRR